ncbi:MAG: hypothetical protein ACK56F_13335, partial [bacterium]
MRCRWRSSGSTASTARPGSTETLMQKWSFRVLATGRPMPSGFKSRSRSRPHVRSMNSFGKLLNRRRPALKRKPSRPWLQVLPLMRHSPWRSAKRPHARSPISNDANGSTTQRPPAALLWRRRSRQRSPRENGISMRWKPRPSSVAWLQTRRPSSVNNTKTRRVNWRSRAARRSLWRTPMG